MLVTQCIGAAGRSSRALGILAVSVVGLLVGACAQNGVPPLEVSTTETGSTSKPAETADTRSELQKATEYWGKAYAKTPQDAQSALNYARNLKALGEKQQALAVIQQAAVFHPSNRAIVGEYGRIALDLDQVSIAQKLLEQADDPVRPDWKVISARGTALAKQGKYQEAMPFYEKALTLAPDQPSVLNNIALAQAMAGNPDKAEELLKRATVKPDHHAARINQNLAIVLGLQGKYEEAKVASAGSLSTDAASANADYMRRLVNIEPKGTTTKIAAKPVKEPRTRTPELKGGAVVDDAVAAAESVTGWTTKVAAAKKPQ